MTPQQHADHLLKVWQQNRKLPPLLRLQKIACLDGPLMPVPVRVAHLDDKAGEFDFDPVLSAVTEAMWEPS
ncbi:hypothetical protein ACRAVF_34035 (plasmid) [Bradyrhizobium oligotrophicum S58]